MAHSPVIQPVILSGGTGTRLWPVSRQRYPKQLVALTSRYSLIQETALRLADSGFAPPVVLCNEAYRFIVAEHLRTIGLEPARIVLEPEGRNTAPAIAVAALLTPPETILLVMPSDHVIRHKDRFQAAVTLAVSAAARGKLVTFGITPDRPETGYGYIRHGLGLEDLPGVHRVEQFVEKPDLATAQRFLAEGGYLWNSGLFAFQAGLYLAELERFQPGMTNACCAALEGASCDSDFYRLHPRHFRAVPSLSIDQAIMEHTPHAAVVPVDMGWSDVGSWAALWEISEKDAAGNVLRGDALAVDSQDSYVSSEGLLTAVVGIRDLVVVTTRNACLVVPREKAQQIRAIVDHLKRRKRPEYMTHTTVYRLWGHYRCIEVGTRFQVKHITVNPGEKLQIRKHRYWATHWINVHGTALVLYGEGTFLLSENHAANIPAGVRHRLENCGREPLQVIEIQLGPCLAETDPSKDRDFGV